MISREPQYGRFTVVFHSAEPSPAVQARAEHMLDKLLHVQPNIIHGTLTIEGRHRHHHQGNVFHVSLHLHLPGREIVVSRDPERNHAHEDIYVALRDACDAARSQLEAIDQLSGKGSRHARSRFESNPRRGEPF